MNKNNTILLFENIECLNKADNRFADIILIKESTELKKISDNIYEVGKEENSYLDLFSCLKSENRLPKRIVHLIQHLRIEQDCTNFFSLQGR